MDFLYAVVWWFCILLLGIAALPITSKVFASFFDKGYLFSKTIGIGILSYLVWLLSSLRLAAFTRLTIVVILLLALASEILILSKKFSLKKWVAQNVNLKFFVLEEVMFFLALLFWAYIRGFYPKIQGLEKFMDVGFVNSILRTAYMPPADMWFAGGSINYYYFGHYITAFLTKLSSIPSGITYNLMMATLFAFAFTLAFSLTANLSAAFQKRFCPKALLAGLIAACLICFGANLHPVLFAKVLPALKNMGVQFDSELVIRDRYWFPDATRYIGQNPPADDKPIHEFPAYSFVVSDLHAHVLNIPFTLTLLALILACILARSHPSEAFSHPENRKLRVKDVIRPELVLIGFFIGLFQMTNFWDFPIYLTVTAISFTYANFIRWKLTGTFFAVTSIQVAATLLLSFIVSLPFSLNFVNMTNGIALTGRHSPLYQLLVLWGYQLAFFIVFVVYLFRVEKNFKKRTRFAKLGYKEKKRAMIQSVNTPKSFHSYLAEFHHADVFVLLLCLCAIGLIIIPELIIVKDIYSGAYERSNTMFKLVYQSFILFCITTGYIAVRIFEIRRPALKHSAVLAGAAVLIICPLLYSFYSIPSWYANLKNHQSLDGMKFLSQLYPDDARAIEWLNKNVEGQPVILEASGDSYTDYGRISMATGLPAILGWSTHEWLWRNNNQVVNARSEEVRRAYESANVDEVKGILEKYQVKYIIIGQLERDKFKSLNEALLLSLGETVFDSPGAKVIKMK